jgi:hypothetical protein
MAAFGQALECKSEGSHALTCDAVNIASKLYKPVSLINPHPDGQAVRRQVFTHVGLPYLRVVIYNSWIFMDRKLSTTWRSVTVVWAFFLHLTLQGVTLFVGTMGADLCFDAKRIGRNLRVELVVATSVQS